MDLETLRQNVAAFDERMRATKEAMGIPDHVSAPNWLRSRVYGQHMRALPKKKKRVPRTPAPFHAKSRKKGSWSVEMLRRAPLPLTGKSYPYASEKRGVA